MSMILDGSNGVTFNDSSLQGAAASPYGLKNRIINGDMRIDQRNAGASSTATSTGSVYNTVDRWNYYASVGSKFTLQQNAGSVTPPTGFTNYLGITSSAATTIGSSDIYVIQQFIEGYNVADLDFGKATAKTITLSFWVRSSLTGTFGLVLQNDGDNRTYPITYTISSANTWEQKTITIAGDTTGTWLTTNGTGFKIRWQLAMGSAYKGTSGAWTASTVYGVTGATDILATNGATFYITGIQLEVGSTATPFERRMYGTELALCQRYCYRASYTGTGTPVGAGFWSNSTLVATACKLATTMRSAPTISYSSIGDIQFLDRDVAWRAATSSLVINEAGTDAVNVGAVCSTGSTQGYGTVMEIRVANGWFQFSAEL